LWNIRDYAEVRTVGERVLSGHSDAVLSAAFSPNGRNIVTASRDRTAKTFDARSGALKRSYSEGHSFLASSAQFFPDGTRLLTTAGDGSTRVWSIASGAESFVLDDTGASAVAA